MLFWGHRKTTPPNKTGKHGHPLTLRPNPNTYASVLRRQPLVLTFDTMSSHTTATSPAIAAQRMSKIRQRAAEELDVTLGAEVGRALLSATLARDAHVSASLHNFSEPIASSNATNQTSTERAQLQSQILMELDTFLGLADIPLLHMKLHQQQQQNRKLLQRNNRIAKRTAESLIRAAHTGDSSILLRQLSTDELESIKMASMSLSGESGGEGGGGTGGGDVEKTKVDSVGDSVHGHGGSTGAVSRNSKRRRHKNKRFQGKAKAAKASSRRRTSKTQRKKKSEGNGDRDQSLLDRGRDLLRSSKKSFVPPRSRSL